MEMLKKLLEKKLAKDGEMDPKKKEAKIAMLKELQNEANGMMVSDLKSHKSALTNPKLEDSMETDGPAHSLKKVSVISDDAEGLEEGLHEAKEVLDSMPGDMHAEEAVSESPAKPEGNNDGMSMAEIEAEIARLMEKKKKLR